MMKSNNYNFIAPIYNLLTKIVFLGSIQKSQDILLDLLPNEGNALFIGGGSGATLKKIVQLKPKLKIDYIDKSEKMIRLSKKKLSSNNVTFIVGDESDIRANNYDALITFFYLDLFRMEHQKQVFNNLHQRLAKNGLWLVVDFNPPQNFFQQVIAKTMFLFLSWTTRIESQEIMNINSLFPITEYQLIKETDFYGKFIFSNAYIKIKTE